MGFSLVTSFIVSGGQPHTNYVAQNVSAPPASWVLLYHIQLIMNSWSSASNSQVHQHTQFVQCWDGTRASCMLSECSTHCTISLVQRMNEEGILSSVTVKFLRARCQEWREKPHASLLPDGRMRVLRVSVTRVPSPPGLLGLACLCERHWPPCGTLCKGSAGCPGSTVHLPRTLAWCDPPARSGLLLGFSASHLAAGRTHNQQLSNLLWEPWAVHWETPHTAKSQGETH